MASLALSIAVLLTILHLGFNQVSAAGSDEEFRVCQKKLARIMKRQLELFSVCMKDMEFKSRKDRSNKLHCIFKCLAIRDGLLDKEGHVDRNTIKEYIHREVHESMRARAVDIMETCIDIGYGKVDPNEENCKSYAPLIKCAIDAIGKFCDDLKPDVVKE